MAKISIIGAGFVGSTTAFALVNQNIAEEIVLVDINREKAEGEALDLANGLVYSNTAQITFSDKYDVTKDSDIIVITAGLAQKPGQTRLELVERNAKIMKGILTKLKRYNKNAIYVLVSNPVDILTYVAKKVIGDDCRVFGTGTSLDTARLKDYVGKAIHINPKNVHSYILGEHGDSSFPVWSLANSGNIPLKDYSGMSEKNLNDLYKQVKNSAYEIINKKGATYYAIALAVTHICDIIVHDKNEILPLSTIPKEYGIKDVCLSVPCVLGDRGIERVLKLKLSKKEQSAMKKSASILKEYVKRAESALKR